MYINSRISKRTQLLSGIAAVLMLAALVIGCKTNVNNAPETFTVTFSVDGGNGTLKAKADGIAETDKNPITVEKDKTVTFTAKADAGYAVGKWTVTPSETLKAGGNEGSETATVKVNANTTVTVTFKGTVAPPSPIPEGFVKITPPAEGIAGKDPTYELPGMEAFWKGVFIKDRRVKLSPYSLGKTEVPYKLWKEVYDWAVKSENGYKFANEGKKGSNGNGSEDEPVTEVSWRDCIVWCNAYTQKIKGEGECVYRKKDDHTVVLKDATDQAACDAAYADMSKKGYRLPTEAEWEYAARWQGSDNTNADKYGEVWLTKLNSASGAKAEWNTADETKAVAWYGDNSDRKTHPVGEKRKNALGLHDMSGNVCEWCFDRYGNIETGDVTDPLGAASGGKRVRRGGSWGSDAELCVVGFRGRYEPDDRYGDLGFRLACRP